MDGYNLDDSIIEYIAKNIKSNIRELEGSLNKIIAYANLEKREVTMELAETVLKDIISPMIRRSSLRNISSILWPNIMTSHRRILLVQKETVKSSILGRLPCIFAVNWPIFR